MLTAFVSIIIFALFISILSFGLNLKNNPKKKNNTSCSGGCSVCKH